MGAEAAKAERQRVRDLLARDKADRAAEQFRAEAQERFESGDDKAASDAVVPPTPEWERQGDVETYYPRQPKGSVRVVKTVRRMRTPVAERMRRKGHLSDEGAAACRWYASLYEQTGLIGLIPSTDMGKEVFAGPQDRVAFTERQQQAASDWRAARRALPARYVRFFEAVVLHDLPIHRAAPFARMRRSDALTKFRKLADVMADHRSTVEGD